MFFQKLGDSLCQLPNLGLPVALAQSFSKLEGAELTEPAGTLQSSLVDNNPGATSWTAELTAAATNGTVVVHPDGLFTYAPAGGFIGTDVFSYTLTDNLGYVSAPPTVTLMVNSVPPATTTTVPSTITTLTSTAAPPAVPVPSTVTTPPADATSPAEPPTPLRVTRTGP
jgi:Bacterial Ig domain